MLKFHFKGVRQLEYSDIFFCAILFNVLYVFV